MFGRRTQSERPRELEGVVTFFGSHHALRAEKVLKNGNQKVRLIPGPREISPNCGVALRFDYGQKGVLVELLEQHCVQYEQIHFYPEHGEGTQAGTG